MFKSVALLFLFVITGFAQDYIVFFDENPAPGDYYDASWGYVTPPSVLELVNSNKFPVEKHFVFSGGESLRMKWTSNSGGDWGIAIAQNYWQANDMTQYDTLSYWMNSPEPVPASSLPDIALEDISGRKSSRAWLGDFLNGVDGDTLTWQRVSIPISVFVPGTEGCDLTVVKTIFHYQRNADGVAHTVWLDQVRAGKKGAVVDPSGVPVNLIAKGQDSRIDLQWETASNLAAAEFNIYRSQNRAGPYARLNSSLHNRNLYSDFFGENNRTYYYYVTSVNALNQESAPSDTVSATSFLMSDDELLTSVQEATFRYFYGYGHPVSGLAREDLDSGDRCASGASGFGMMAIVVGAERGFISRDSAAARILKMVSFLQDVTPRYHGAWSHWINGATGATIPFSQYDDGGDLVETAYVAQGLLTVRQYFTMDDAVENEIRTRATQLWESIEWDWYLRYPNGYTLFWHWSPNYGWKMNLQIRGFNEAQIVYLLAVASPTHGISRLAYHIGWARSGGTGYVNGKIFYGYKIWVGPDYGGPLFFTHYSYLGFDPRGKDDGYCNYFNNNRNISLINRAYCIHNPLNKAGYDSLTWGLTASHDPFTGYLAHEPDPTGERDNGTIAPTAAISAMPYVPDESIATLKNLYHAYGKNLWGDFGFKDAFNPGQNWYDNSYIGIDQGPIVIMIENYRTQLCWNLFMSNPEVTNMWDVVTGTAAMNNMTVNDYRLNQNYPNPFNPETHISFQLGQQDEVTLSVFNVRGQQVAVIYADRPMPAGEHYIDFNGSRLPSGLYFLKLKTKHFLDVRKMLLVR